MARHLGGIAQGRLRWAGLAMALFALTQAACASQGSHHQFKVRLGEFYFKPDAIQVKVDQTLSLELTNEGKAPHEFMLGHAMQLEDGKPEHYEHDFFNGVAFQFAGNRARLEKEEGHGTMVLLEPGGRAVLTFSVPPGKLGEWEVGCFRPGHYEAGMRGRFIVKLR